MAATLGELRELSLSRARAKIPGNPTEAGDYVRLGGLRIWVTVRRGYIVTAEAPPLAGSPHVNRKWVAGRGMVGLEAARLLRAVAD